LREYHLALPFLRNESLKSLLVVSSFILQGTLRDFSRRTFLSDKNAKTEVHHFFITIIHKCRKPWGEFSSRPRLSCSLAPGCPIGNTPVLSRKLYREAPAEAIDPVTAQPRVLCCSNPGERPVKHSRKRSTNDRAYVWFVFVPRKFISPSTPSELLKPIEGRQHQSSKI
jgi:hypothetical protein